MVSITHPFHRTARFALMPVMLGLVVWSTIAASSGTNAPVGPVTEAQVNASQQAWCDGLVNVAQTYATGGDAKAVAGKMIDDLYEYADGKEVMVDKTFVFRRCKDGNLRLCVHKSALPFNPN